MSIVPLILYLVLVAVPPLTISRPDFSRLGTSYCYADDKQYESLMTRDAVMEAPQWKPSEPLPFPFDKVIEIAREELRMWVKDETKWELMELTLRQTSMSYRWYYAVRFQEETPLPGRIQPGTRIGPRLDSFTVTIDFSGRPGIIKER